jgi:asparagine synthase (glutamine-hydrolysing)
VENAVIAYHAFRKWGVSFVDHLDGDWSVMIFDTVKKELVIAADHLATRSVFYSRQVDGFLFSNSKKALLDAIGDKVPLNQPFILRRLLISHIFSPETCHQGIFPLPPGHALRISESGTLEKKWYWFFDRVKPVEFPKEQVAFRELLSGLGPSHPVRNYIDIPSLIRKMDRFLEIPGMLSGEISRAFGLIFLAEKCE